MSKVIKDGGPAFPEPFLYDPNLGPCGQYITASQATGCGGMTLRDYFMAHAPAMPAAAFDAYVELLRTNEPDVMQLPWNMGVLSRMADQERRWREAYADAMLAARDMK